MHSEAEVAHLDGCCFSNGDGIGVLVRGYRDCASIACCDGRGHSPRRCDGVCPTAWRAVWAQHQRLSPADRKRDGCGKCLGSRLRSVNTTPVGDRRASAAFVGEVKRLTSKMSCCRTKLARGFTRHVDQNGVSSYRLGNCAGAHGHLAAPLQSPQRPRNLGLLQTPH